MNLRLIGIGAGVLVILSLPLAGAIAGPDLAGQDDGKGGGLLSSLGLSGPSRTPVAARNPDATRSVAREALPSEPGPDVRTRTDTRCGPELSSPHGVEAQTCVLESGGRTWGRTYYRNTSGRILDAVLTVMGPEGRTVRIRCVVGAGDEPGLCETPQEDSAGKTADYSAVAEFAVPDDEGQLLLRSGSNSPDPADG
ncbi:hypothetical protein [Streptomyces sp. NPDC048383]|uniref:hypothetical protein n=1 Tax=unclassified Streptomyces TaxID=2593676 RepID=UPI0034317D93